MSDDPVPEFCPVCGDEVDQDPKGKKIVECPEHGEMIAQVILLDEREGDDA